MPHQDASKETFKESAQKPYTQPFSNSSGPQEKKRTTAIALSVITCLFMCVIGYEIIRVDEHAEKAELKKVNGSNPDIALLTPATDSSYSHAFEDGEEEGNYSHFELKILKEQNRAQLAKIKALKQEVLARMQEIHDVKANLFKQEGDPKDKARLAELEKSLSEKEELNASTAEKLTNLETELQIAQKKLSSAELTNEALATLVEKNRLLKEQEVLSLNKGIEELKLAIQEEKKLGDQKLSELKGLHEQALSDSEDKNQGIFYLESEIKRLEAKIEKKNAKLQEIASQQKDEEVYWSALASNITSAHELEMLRSERLNQHLSELYQRHNQAVTDKAHLVNALEDQILYHRNELEKNRHELDSMHDLYALSQHQTKEQLRQLVSAHEAEILRSHHLKQALTTSNLHENATKFAATTTSIQYELVQKQLKEIKEELNGKEMALTQDQLALIKTLESLKNDFEAKERDFEKNQLALTQSLHFFQSHSHLSTTEADALKAQLALLTTSANSLKEELAHAKESFELEKARFEKDVSSLSSLNQYLTTALEQASRNYQELYSTQEQNQLTIDSLTLELNFAEAEIISQLAKSELELADLENKFKSDLEHQTSKVESSRDSFNQKERELSEKIGVLEESLKSEKGLVDSLKGTTRELEKKILTLQYELSREYNEKSFLGVSERTSHSNQNDLNQLQDALHSQKSESNQLQDLLTALQTENNALKAKLEDLQNKLSLEVQEAAPAQETAYQMISPADYFNPRKK